MKTTHIFLLITLVSGVSTIDLFLCTAVW